MDIFDFIEYLENRLKIVQQLHDVAKETCCKDSCNIYFGQEMLINEMLGIFRLMSPKETEIISVNFKKGGKK